MEPDANGFYSMPTAPQPRSFSRDRSPAVMMAPARSTSRQRRNTSSSQERPTSLYVHEGASGRHRSYHLTGPAPGPSYLSASPGSSGYRPSAPMTRSHSVGYNARPTNIRAASTGPDSIQVGFSAGSSKRNSSHTRSSSGAGGVQYYYGGSSRTRPVAYYSAGSHWDGSAGSYGSHDWDEWSPAPSPVPRHSPVGSYSRSPTRHPYDMPTAPQPPVNAYRVEDDLKRLEQARMELEHLKLREAEERDRGRTAERRLREIRTQANADPRLLAKVSEAEKQAAIAIAQQEEAERKLAEAEARAARLEKLAVTQQVAQSKKPQVILQNGKPLKPALKQTVAVTQASAETSATTVNQNMGDQAPPKNPQDYQAKIPKDLISRAALVEKGLTYEEHKDYLLVKRYLSKEDIKALLDRTAEIRKQREAVERYRAAQAAAAAKIQEDKSRPAVATHTTTDGKAVQIVTLPHKEPSPPAPAPPPAKDLNQEWEEWKAEKKAREEARAAEEAEWERKRKANEEKFKQLEEKERRERLIEKEMERQRLKAKQKLQRKGWF
ncbi:hypothetical protein TWF696_008132 [Orbilia brochopaga]|uniref:DUF8035 domain-containing protein n=1 Tax=Orbilia brochopaga TaxID=3140254 RepID=A0AAV9UM81_9PEZI